MNTNSDLRQIICTQFGFGEDVFKKLNDCGMDVESLLLIKDDDINELFPISCMGLRVKFKAKLSHWREKDVDIPSVKSLLTSKPCPSSSSPASPVSSTKLNDILQETPRGQKILHFFNLNSKLNDELRDALINIIVDSYSQKCSYMGTKDIAKFSEEIKATFPTEDMRYYFNSRGKGLNPTGKLYDKATNAGRKLRKKRPATTDANLSVVVPPTEPIVPDENDLELKTWLLYNMTPWDKVCEKWKATFQLRRSEVLTMETKIILSNWPLFKNAQGHSLIELDFEQLFPKNILSISTKWDHFDEVVIPYFKTKIKNVDSKNLLLKLEDDISLDSKNCILTLLIHAVVKPSVVSTNTCGSKRSKWKPSISDAQAAMVLHSVSISEYSQQYEILKKQYTDRNCPVPPLILAIGKDITMLESFHILFDSILYEVPTFLKALDVLFKLHHVMNFKYALEAKCFYEFVECYFYEIQVPRNSNVVHLMNYLNDNL